jgi:CubicO group peptidase (beta-lactamase class C family)
MKKAGITTVAVLLYCISGLAKPDSPYYSKGTGIPDSIETKIDTLVARMGISSETPGGVVGVIRDGRIIFEKAYGLADFKTKTPNTISTLFNLGSTSKQFTAAAILLLAKQNKLSLSDDIRKYFPDFPDYGYPITIENLIHHTSGIKSTDVLCLMAGTLFSEDNREGDYNLIARQKSLNFKPGDEYLYSNSGYILLGKIVEKASGMKFSKFVEENIFRPAGMAHTYIYDNPEKTTANSAKGHVRGGDEKFKISDHQKTTLTGISNVYTNVEDLLQWDNNFYRNRLGNWDFRKEMTAPEILNNGDTCKYAFGLDISEHNGLKTISHQGGTGDFTAQYTQIPSERLTVVCLFNISTDVTGLTYKIIDLYVKGNTKSVAHGVTPDKVKIDSTVLKKYTGKYLDKSYGFIVTISVDSDHLAFEAPYQGKFEIYPSSDSMFFVTFADLKLLFRRNEKGEVAGAAILQGKDRFDLTYLGKDASPLKAEQLSEYAGDYYSEEIDVTYPVIFKDNKLYIRFPESTAQFCKINPESELISEYGDYFASPVSGIEFTRNTDNRITGFRLFNVGRVRNLVFSKSD